MWIIELLFGFLDLITDIQYAKRYGWGSFWLNTASIACLVIAVLQFKDKHYILGIIAIVGCIFFFVKSTKRFIEDLRSKREYEAWKREQENKKKS
jgi:hypothetical protein